MIQIAQANALTIPLSDESVHCIVTSPPYWGLRDYSTDGQLGLERTPEEYIAKMVEVFRECWRVLRDDGTMWMNMGDSYANANPGSGGVCVLNGAGRAMTEARYTTIKRDVTSLKPKDLCGIPWRLALALQADGWYLRSDIIWSKPNPMPESVTDRPTKSHEYLFLLTKSARYYYDQEAVREGSIDGYRINPNHIPRTGRNAQSSGIWRGAGDRNESVERGSDWSETSYHADYRRNLRSVWNIPTAPYSGAHFATFPPALVEPCIKAGTSERGVCPKCGKGWVRVVEKIGEYTTQWGSNHSEARMILQGVSRNDVAKDKMMIAIRDTISWQPSCSCDAGEPVPAIVFDPFVGSGTTLLVARKLGRSGIGIDLSYTYLKDNARERLSMDDWEDWHNGNGNGNGKSAAMDLPLFMIGDEAIYEA